MSNEPRASATVCVLHQGDNGIEVLMVRRSTSARFMAGAWVFPGGVVDADDHLPEALDLVAGWEGEFKPWVVAAFREVVEETGIWLTDPPIVEALGEQGVRKIAQREGRVFTGDRAAYFANWITPTMVPARFDARFFMIAIDRRVTAIPDGREIDSAEFVSPSVALRRAEDGEWLIPFPTMRTLEQLDAYASVDEALDVWHHRTVEPVQPRLRVAADGSLEVVMPGEPGFDELADAEPDPEVLAQAARASAEKGAAVAEVPDD